MPKDTRAFQWFPRPNVEHRPQRGFTISFQKVQAMSPRRFSSQPVTLSFPPFTPAISWLVGINVAVYLLLAALRLAAPALPTQIIAICAVTPAAGAPGWTRQSPPYD